MFPNHKMIFKNLYSKARVQLGLSINKLMCFEVTYYVNSAKEF